MNRKFEAMVGVEREIISQHVFSKFIFPADRHIYDHQRQLLFASDTKQSCELRLVSSVGMKFWVQLELYLIERDEHCAIHAAVIDIDKYKISEESLRESVGKLRFLTENSSDIIWHLDLNCCFDYINSADEKMRGYKYDEVIGTTIWSLLKPEGIEQVKDTYIHRLSEEEGGVHTGIARYELELICKDGSWIWTEVVVTPHHNDNGYLIGFYGIARDISERKRVEVELYASKNRYRELITQSFEALSLTDLETREIVEVNSRFTEMIGYSLPEDAPLYVDKFVMDSKENLDKRFNSILRQQRVLQTETMQFQHKNGTVVIVERAGTVINIEGRDYLLASLRDMTAERRRQVAAMRDAELARNVQCSLLSKIPQVPFVSIRTLYYPSHLVSGDSFHLEWKKNKKILLGFLIDVTGHGIATALQSASINVLIKELSTSKMTLMEKIKWINVRAEKYFVEDTFAAMLGFEIDFSAGELHWVSAGIPQFIANGQVIRTPGMFIGLWKEADFGEGFIPFKRNDTFHFLTDGYIDILSISGKSAFWSPERKNFDDDIAALERLIDLDGLRDDATGICLRINSLYRDK